MDKKKKSKKKTEQKTNDDDDLKIENRQVSETASESVNFADLTNRFQYHVCVVTGIIYMHLCVHTFWC